MNQTDSNLKAVREEYRQNRKSIEEDFFTFLRFASVSSEPDHKADVLACKDWLLTQLSNVGLETEEWPTSGHPVLFAQHCHAGPDKPTLLIYCHYDVQPVDPLELWETPPFEPTVRDGEVFARGAADNKGQCFYTIKALQDILKRDGSLPLNVKLLIEGEEEIGSSGLAEILPKKRQEVQADYVMIVDLGIPSPNQPAVTVGTRGIVSMTVEVTGSKGDLHSGSFGGMVYNPLHALVDMLASLRDSEGRITVKGFYDDVEEPSDTLLNSLQFDFDEQKFKETFQAGATGGEKKYPPKVRATLRPTLEINGINGGYGGEGFKTVIPARAIAKISCRLVGEQDPLTIGEKVKKHLESHTPPGITTRVVVHPGVGKASMVSPENEAARAFAHAYKEVFQTSCSFMAEGGSIPITPELAEAAGAEAIMIGVALPDDNIHAPNEHFGLDRLEKGYLLITRGIEILSEGKDGTSSPEASRRR